MTDKEFIKMAKDEVIRNAESTGDHITSKDVFMVWYNYTAGNYKAMFGTTANSSYYEVTYIERDKVLTCDEYAMRPLRVVNHLDTNECFTYFDTPKI